MSIFRSIFKDEKGASVIMVTIALLVIFGFAVVVIDMSLIQLAKTQLQNAADAGALAGALSLATTSGSQAEKEAAATAEAIRVCSLNVALQEIDRSVLITPADVTFPQPTQVRVNTGHGGRVATYFLRVLDPLLPEEEEITATAVAGAELVCGTDCLKPFCPPDRWDDRDGDEAWDDEEPYNDLNGNDSYDPGEPFNDVNGDLVWTPAEFYDPEITGYKAPDDIGVQVTLKLRNSSQSPRMGWYYAIDYPPKNIGDPITGASMYRDWISGDTCEPWIVNIGDQLQIEPGNMVGPTNQGLERLIEQDPTAEWDPVTGTVINSAFSTSPRIVKAPAFDPTIGVEDCGSGRDCVVISKIMVLFIEGHEGADVVGRFMQTITEGVPDPDCPGGFMYTVVLVE